MLAFQTVLDDHGPPLYRHLVGVLGPHDGADCYQETVIAALRAWPPKHDGNLRSWLFTIGHRKVIDHARARGRRPVPVDTLPEGGAAGPIATGVGVGGVALATAPVDAGLRFDDDAAVWDAVRSLPEKQRVAVALRHADDWGYDEIAVVLECSEAAARQSVKAGLDRLKEVLAR